MNIRQTAEKLFAKICGARYKCVDIIVQSFEDVAVDFAWEVLERFQHHCGAGTTRSALRLSFDDYSKGRPIIRYPSYKHKTQYDEAFNAKEVMSYTCPECGHIYLGGNHCPRCYDGIRWWLRCHGSDYKTDMEIAREKIKRKRAYDDIKYGYTARPGIDLDDGDPDKGLPVGYISPKDADYLWECLPEWIKDGPGDKCMKPFPTWYGTLTYYGDLEVHNEVKRILNRQ